MRETLVRQQIAAKGIPFVLAKLSPQESVLLFALPYTPRTAPDPETGFIDSYYEAYQKIFALRNRIAEELQEAGIPCTGSWNGNYPTLAARSGLGVLLRNGLVMRPGWGTFFTMESLVLPDCGGTELFPEPERNPLCQACTLCRNHCPVRCIGESPDAACCLRERQKEGYPEEESSLLAGNRVLGCNLCQSVCPHNREQRPEATPDRFRLTRLFQAAASGKKALAEYEDVFGKNYLRPKWLLSLVINAMANHPTEEFAACIRSLPAQNDARVVRALKRFTDRFSALR